MQELPREAVEAPQPLIAQVLQEALNEGCVDAKSVSFVSSLLEARKKYGSWTQKQDFWARVKYADALGLTAPYTFVQKNRDLTGYGPILEQMQKAGTSLQDPKIHLLMSDGQPLTLSLNKVQGKVVLTNGKHGYDSKWYGYVVQGGDLIVSNKIDPDRKAKVIALMKSYLKDPVGTVASYGSATGTCSFCHKTLTDPQSVAAGFGPVCAAKYGLLAAYKTAKAPVQFVIQGGIVDDPIGDSL